MREHGWGSPSGQDPEGGGNGEGSGSSSSSSSTASEAAAAHLLEPAAAIRAGQQEIDFHRVMERGGGLGLQTRADAGCSSCQRTQGSKLYICLTANVETKSLACTARQERERAWDAERGGVGEHAW